MTHKATLSLYAMRRSSGERALQRAESSGGCALSSRCWETATTSTGMKARLPYPCSGTERTNKMPSVSPGLGSLRGRTEEWTGRKSVWVLAMSQVQN